MVELSRLRVNKVQTTQTEGRAAADRQYLTASAIQKLPRKGKQYLVWDAWDEDRKRGPEPAKGLCVLVSPGGAKSFRCAFYFRDNPAVNYLHLGSVGELLERNEGERDTHHLTREIEEARRRTRNARALAQQEPPIDPRGDRRRGETVEAAIKAYIKDEQIGRRKNTSAGDTQTIMLDRCAPWLKLPITAIHYHDIEKLLGAVRDGSAGRKPSPSMAARLFAHLRDFFKWEARPGGPLKASPMQGMPGPATVKRRDRFYTEVERKVIWAAAGQLKFVDGSYVKLMMLLGLRKNELAKALWAELDDPDEPTLFTVPTARVKLKASKKAEKKVVYRVPLPPLAQRLLKGLRGRHPERVFHGLDKKKLKASLVEHGAPKDFMLHTFRHTIATWLENNGRSEWERGLILNHSNGSSVTSGYSHGHATDLKRTMLCEWAAHIEGLVGGGEGVAVLY